MVIRKYNFIIFPVSHGWIVYNIDKDFKKGHTHLKNKASALALVDFVYKEKIPRKCGLYYLISLCRVSDNDKYVAKVMQLVNVRKVKGKKLRYVRRK